jgi:general stress protein YciG
MAPNEVRGRRGFAAMDPEERREIARRGGEASARSRPREELGFAAMDPEERREIARRGGEASARSRPREELGFAAMDPEERREIARRGGEASARSRPRDARGRFEEDDHHGSREEDEGEREGESAGGLAALDPEKRRGESARRDEEPRAPSR